MNSEDSYWVPDKCKECNEDFLFWHKSDRICSDCLKIDPKIKTLQRENEELKDKLYHSTRDIENKWYEQVIVLQKEVEQLKKIIDDQCHCNFCVGHRKLGTYE